MQAVTFWHLGGRTVAIGLDKALDVSHGSSESVLDLLEDREVGAVLHGGSGGGAEKRAAQGSRLRGNLGDTFLEEHILYNN